MKHIVAVTTSRADYGIIRPILLASANSSELRMELLAMGTHLAECQGETLSEIEADGFCARIVPHSAPTSDDPRGIAGALSGALDGTAEQLAEIRPDMLLVAGDRFETFAATAAAVPFALPCAHIHGGEITEGAIDDVFRHAITKMSHLHFPSTQIYGDRIAQMGEEPWRIHVCGAPSLDNINLVPSWTRKQLESSLSLSLSTPTLLVTLHPETLAYQDTDQQVAILLDALDEVGLQAVFTGANVDTRGSRIRSAIQSASGRTDRYRMIASLGQVGYFGLMKHASAMVGNSSSGLIEAPSFELPVVNIGDRQKGRIRGDNVLDVPWETQAIAKAIQTAVSPAFKTTIKQTKNPYGDGHTANRIVDVLERIPVDKRLLRKRFMDAIPQQQPELKIGRKVRSKLARMMR